MFRVVQENPQQQLSSPPPLVSFYSPLLAAPPPGSSVLLRLGPTAVGFTSGERELLTPGRLAVRHRHTDGPPPRHCIISGTSHVTRTDGRVAFVSFGPVHHPTPARPNSQIWTDAEIQSRSSPAGIFKTDVGLKTDLMMRLRGFRLHGHVVV